MEYIALKDVCKINMGQSPKSSSYNENGEGIPFFQGNADFGERYPVTRVWCNAPTKIANAGDILISVRAPIGALNYAKEECCIGRGLAAITPDPGKFSTEFIFWLLRGKNAELNSKGTGSTFKAIGRKVLEETLVPDYGFKQQHICAENLEKVYAIIRMRKQELLKMDEFIKARFVEMFGDPEINTKGYQKEPLQKHADVLVGYPFKSEGYTEGGVGIVGGYNLMQGFIIWEDCKYWPDTDGFEQYLLKDGDIVMAMDRPWVNGGFKIASVDKEHLPALLIQRTACIRGKDVEQEFLYSLLNSHWFADHCNITGSLVPHISNKDINSYEIVLPPIEEQKVYAEFVRQVDKSKVAVQKLLDETKVLFDALMQKYFG